MNTLVSPENTWVLMTVMLVSVAVSVYLEQTYAWASRISGAVIALIFALVLVNTSIIPPHAELYDDIVWGYIVPIAIPLLLLQTNIVKIWRETGRLLIIFLIGAAGTICGALIGCVLLGSAIDGLPKVAAMMTGSYIGGGVNFTALADAFKVSGTLVSSTIVADNLNMAIYFLILLGIAGNGFFRRMYTHPLIDHVEKNGASDEGKTLAATYWGRKDISLRDIAMCVTYAVVVVTVSKFIGATLGTLISPDVNWFTKMCNTFLSSQYVWITLISMIFATFFEKQASSWCAGNRHVLYLYVLLCDRCSRIYHGDSDECAAALCVLSDYGHREYAVLSDWRKAVRLFPGGYSRRIQREYRRSNDGSRHGNLSGVECTGRTCDACGNTRVCDRHLSWDYCRQPVGGIRRWSNETGYRYIRYTF